MSIDLRSHCRSARTIPRRPGGLRKRAPPCAVEHLLIYAESGEPTSGLEPLFCSLRVCGRRLLDIAEVCKSCIDRGFCVPCIAHCCTVLRPDQGQTRVTRA